MKNLKTYDQFVNEDWASFIDRSELANQKAEKLKTVMEDDELPFSDSDAKAIARALGKPISKLKVVFGTSEDDGYSKEYETARKIHFAGQKDGPVDLPHKGLKDISITINKKAGTVQFDRSWLDGRDVSGFVYESEEFDMDESLNESFATSDTAEAIFKDIDKKYDYLQLNADTYEEIKKALMSTGGDMLHSYEEIVKSRNFNKRLQKDWTTGIHKNVRFYFALPFKGSKMGPVAGDKIISILNRQPGRKNYTDWEYNDGEWFRGWGGNDRETHFIAKYPKLFKENVYHIYSHSDTERGYGYRGTLGYYKGHTEDEARKKGQAENPQISHRDGIEQLNKSAVQKHLKHANQKAEHWAKLAKQISKL